MKGSFLDEACGEVAVRCGGFTPETHGAFRGGVSHQLARDVFYRREVGGSARANAVAHPIEEAGARLRAMMPWIGADKLVDKEKK